MKRLFAIAAIGFTVWMVVLMAARKPVLLRLTPDPTELRPRYYCVMNPFRDRAPEEAVEQYLQRLKSGDTQVLHDLVRDPEWREQLIANETKWPVLSWRITQRKDTPRESEVMYQVKRGGGYDAEEEVYFGVQRSRNGDARVTSFSALY